MRISRGYWSLWTGLLFALPAFTPLAQATVPAPPLSVTWEASPDVKATGYGLYYGLVNSPVTNRVETGTARQITLQNLSMGSNYFFFAVAYDANGIESDPTDTLFYTPWILSDLQVTALGDGTMRIQFHAPPGAICRVERAAAPAASWQTLANATADVTGAVVVDDPPEGRPLSRFYRAAMP